MTLMEMLAPTVQRITTTLPSLLIGLGILVAGYVIAKMAAGIVSRVLSRTRLDTLTAEGIGLTKPGGPDAVRGVAARIAFWLVMLFVWIGFFNEVGLPLVAEPLRGVADAIARVAPSVLHAGLIFVAAWILAGLLRWLVVKTLTRLDVERRFGHFLVPEGADPRGLVQTLGTLTFSLVLLLAAPPSWGPWDRAPWWPRSPRCSASCSPTSPTWLRRSSASDWGGWWRGSFARWSAIFWPEPASTGRWSALASHPPPGECARQPSWGRSFTSWSGSPSSSRGSTRSRSRRSHVPPSTPSIPSSPGCPRGLGGAVLLSLAWIVSRLVGNLATQLLRGVGFDGLPTRLGLAALQSPRGRTPSDLVGVVVRTLVLVFASIETFEVIGLHRLAGFGDRLVGFMINVVIATAIVGVGLWAGNLVQGLVGGPLARTGAVIPRRSPPLRNMRW